MREIDRNIEQSDYIKIPSREKLLRSVRKTLKEATFPTAIYLEGLSGSGKSSLARQLEDVIDTMVVEDFHSVERVWDNNLHLVLPLTPHEASMLEGKSGREIQRFIVKGLDPKESASFLSKIPRLSKLTDEQITNYSSGLPELLKMFSTLDSVTPDAAMAIASRYLQTLLSAPGYLKDKNVVTKSYLEVAILPEVLKAAKESVLNWGETNNIYDRLHLMRHFVQSFNLKGKFDMNTVFFKDQKSVEIYNDSLKSREKSLTRVYIFVPQVPIENQAELMETFGIERKGPSYYRSKNGSDRQIAFGAYERKLLVYIEDGNGQEILEGLDVLLEQAQDTFKKYKQTGSFSLLVSAHEHHGAELDIVLVGWMLESLLQNRGIEYYAYNGIIDKKYRYNPNSRKIVFGGF